MNLKNLFEVFTLEAKNIFTSISAMMIIFGGSLFYLFLYPTPYYQDVVATQKIAIVDYDNTTSSRELIHFIKASPYLTITDVLQNEYPLQDLIESNAIYGAVIVPKDFEKRLYQRNPPTIPIIANASYLLIYGAIANAMSDVVDALNSHIQHKLNIQQHDILQPKLIPLFNPSMGYINYTLAPVLLFILHQTLIAGAGIIGGTQNQQFAQGVRNHYATANPLIIVLSKIFIFVCLYILLFAFYFGFAYEFYGVNVNAHMLDFWLFSLAFILSTSAFGVFFGAILNKRTLSTQIIMIASMPIVFLLGFMWPKAQIAPWATEIVSFLPAYHGINGLLQLNQMGASFSSVWGYVINLLCLAMLYIGASVIIIYKKTQRVSNTF